MVDKSNPEEKLYTQKDLDAAVNNTRIQERHMASTLMGNLGVPVASRLSPDGQPIYEQADKIIMSLLMRNPGQPVPPEKKQDDEVSPTELFFLFFT